MSDHEIMMNAFRNQHGEMRDYKTKEERDMWLSWLGSFVLGWEAHKAYLETLNAKTEN